MNEFQVTLFVAESDGWYCVVGSDGLEYGASKERAEAIAIARGEVLAGGSVVAFVVDC